MTPSIIVKRDAVSAALGRPFEGNGEQLIAAITILDQSNKSLRDSSNLWLEKHSEVARELNEKGEAISKALGRQRGTYSLVEAVKHLRERFDNQATLLEDVTARKNEWCDRVIQEVATNAKLKRQRFWLWVAVVAGWAWVAALILI